MATVTIRVESDDPTPSRVEGVVVEVYSTSAVFQTGGVTNADGEVVFSLPDADYDVVFYKAGVSILPRQPQRITVDSSLSNTFLVSSHVRSLPEALDPLHCRVSGHVFGADGIKTKTRLVFTPSKELLVLGGNIIAPEAQVDVASDEDGYFEFDLLRGIKYEAYFLYQETLLGMTPGKLDIAVPDRASINLGDLLFPIPSNTQFSTDSLSLVEGGEEDDSIEIIATFTDSNVRKVATVWAGIILTNDNPDAVEARMAEGKLFLLPKAPGVANISTQRVFGSDVLWSPTPDYTTETVVVTVTAS